jgi:hypothetical protein
MSTLTDYSSYQEIRSILGVSATELPDDVLNQPSYSTLLLLALEDVSVNIPTVYATVAALPELSRTAAQQRFYLLARLFASYTLSLTATASMPLFAVTQLSDGRAEFQRQDNSYKDVIDAIKGMHGSIKEKLALAYSVLYPLDTLYTQSSFDFMVASTLGTDPVTTTTV